MPRKSTLLLCLLAILAIASVVLVETISPRQPRGTMAFSRPLFGEGGLLGALPGGVPNAIVIQRSNSSSWRLEHRDDGWVQVEPVPHPLDDDAIGLLLTSVLSIASFHSPDPAEWSAEALGLDPPRGALILEWDEQEVKILFGRRGIAGRAWVRISGDERFWMTGQQLHAIVLDSDIRGWRSRALFPDNDGAVDVAITNGGASFSLERTSGRWNMTSPVATRLDDLALERLLGSLASAVSSGYVLDTSMSVARFGLELPAAEIRVTSTVPRAGHGDRDRQERDRVLHVGARIGGRSEDRYGMMEGSQTVFRLAEDLLRKILLPPRSLYARNASGMVGGDIHRIEVRAGDRMYTLERDLDAWLLDGTEPVEGVTVDRLLDTLCIQSASSISRQLPPSLLEVAVITLHDYEGTVRDRIRLARLQEAFGPGSGWIMMTGDGLYRHYPSSLSLPITREMLSSDEGKR